jgi:D-glycero-alpha-D-manno-heptose-7-phosphate kinase
MRRSPCTHGIVTRRVLIRAKTPLRISFAGGGTDVPPFPEREGGLVLNATISRYAYGTLVPGSGEQISIESVDYGMTTTYGIDESLEHDGKLDMAKAAIRNVEERYPRRASDPAEKRRFHQGFELFLHSDAPPGTGLGSSSAMAVTLIGLLKEFRHLEMTEYDIASLACSIEREDLGIKGGLQDQYATTFGGFNLTEFGDDRVIVNPLRIPPDALLELEQCLLLCYSGVSRTADHIIDDQTQRFEQHNDTALEGLQRQKVLAVQMKEALLERRLTDFGELLHEAWQAKKNMSSRISNDRIDEMYEEARRHGAIGGKVTGAGGGGYMLFYCDYRTKHRVAQAMLAMDARVEEFAFAQEGMRTWRVS